MAKLAKLADFKTQMDLTATNDDAFIGQCLDRATAIAEQLCRRPLVREVDRVEFPEGEPRYSRFARLAVFPIESVASVKQLTSTGTDAIFTAATGLVENEDYVVDAAGGQLERIGAGWLLAPRCLRVQYTAGYIDPATAEIPEGAILPPDDLQNAILQQALRLFQHRKTGGTRDVSFAHGGGVNFTEAKPHPALLDVCAHLRRWSL